MELKDVTSYTKEPYPAPRYEKLNGTIQRMINGDITSRPKDLESK